MTQTQAVTFKGNPITLLGTKLRVGDVAPNVTVSKSLVEEISLYDLPGKTKILSVVPSIDTSVCDLQAKRFNEIAQSANVDTKVYVVSADLPFAQARWCGANEANAITTLSDYKEHQFGKAYGVLIQEFMLNMRSIFIIDESNKIKYMEIVSEMSEHPNYEAALKAINT